MLLPYTVLNSMLVVAIVIGSITTTTDDDPTYNSILLKFKHFRLLLGRAESESDDNKHDKLHLHIHNIPHIPEEQAGTAQRFIVERDFCFCFHRYAH